MFQVAFFKPEDIKFLYELKISWWWTFKAEHKNLVADFSLFVLYGNWL